MSVKWNHKSIPTVFPEPSPLTSILTTNCWYDSIKPLNILNVVHEMSIWSKTLLDQGKKCVSPTAELRTNTHCLSTARDKRHAKTKYMTEQNSPELYLKIQFVPHSKDTAAYYRDQPVYVVYNMTIHCIHKRKAEARSRNHCCRGKALSITYSQCVSIALVIQNTKRVRHIMFSRNHCCCGKALSITYSLCVSIALVIQHTKRVRHIMLSSVTCPVLPYFPHYLINDTSLDKTLFNIQHVFWHSLVGLSEIFLVLRIQRDNMINVHRSSCKLSVNLARF
jgi:hypothetical protein